MDDHSRSNGPSFASLSSTVTTSRGQKRPQTEEVSKAFKGRAMTNPYIIFKEEFIKGVREAEPFTTYILKTLTKRAGKRWKEMSEADKAPYIRSANEAKAKKPKKKRKTAVDEAGPKLFPGVMDLDAIPHYAWPLFILDLLMDTNPTMESIHSQSAHSPPKRGVAKAKSKKPPLKKAKKPVLKRKRRLTSEVWKYFDILDKPKKENHPDNENDHENDPENPDDDENDLENPDDVNDEPEKCKCKKCGQVYLSGSKYGTGNLKRHLLVCLKSETMDIGQMLVSKNGALQLAKFNPNRFRELLVHVVIRHDLPLSFVEYDGVRNIFTYLNPEAHSISRRTIRTAILSLHEKEYQTLGRNLRTLPGRVCLTSDLWTSIATDGYMSLTATLLMRIGCCTRDF
ncbi:hypothetical protein RHSIM_Rhsim05G0096800 [Rhododendron simsii]|uniref:HMG box domain-containing protein n=1 Tax=Rhododendron simsii TaxID=118357 RepID=A0A834GZH1_RHOSS|nr:hypothetical protein RHSIM_Rhsim05G0096800 [Rhododendron simsii]